MNSPAQKGKPLSFRMLGEKGSNPTPIIDKLWEFYSQKGVKTVFVSLGTSTSPLAELEIGEILGCPVNIVETSETNRELWNEVSEILKTRKREETSSEFTLEVQNKWVLPKNIRISDKLPFFFDGTLDLSGNSCATISWNRFIQEICEKMGIGLSPRLDLLNIQLDNQQLNDSILYSLTNSNFRPGLILISYPSMPDSNLLTTQAAGHLQNIGYQLLNKEGNKFLYRYNDKNVYEYASYENKEVENPLVSELIRAASNF